MPEDQKEIYYGSASSKSSLNASPQMDVLKSKGYNVLVLSDDVDEFMISILTEYDGKKFKSINQGDLDLQDDKVKEEVKTLETENKDLLESIKAALGSEVDEVKLSTRLTESPVCLVSGEGLSFEMEKVINQMPGDKDMKAKKILEINPQHELFQAIERIYTNTPESIEDYANLLYNQALLIEGLPIKDPVDFSNKMVKVLIKAANIGDTNGTDSKED